jgi:hypothetical protein
MNKKILKSDSALVLIGEKLPLSLSQDRGRFFGLVQGCDFTVQADRQKIKSIGTKRYLINDSVKAPNVDLNLRYYLSSYINNELLMGFRGSEKIYEPGFADMKSMNNNFYIMMERDAGKDGMDEIRKEQVNQINFSGFDVLSFGNSYLKKYSINFNVGQIPVVNASFACSNVKFDSLTDNTLKVPSVSPYGIEDDKKLNLSTLYLTIKSGYVSGNPSVTEYNLPAVVPSKVNVFLDELEIGGAPLGFDSEPLVQSLSIDIDFPRNDLYGLGSNYVFDRKIQYPINATININTLVSGLNSGFISEMYSSEALYGLTVRFADEQEDSISYYAFKKLRLESFSYSLDINNILNYNASFSCQITDDSNFFIKRIAIFQDALYSDFDQIWRKFQISWNNI